MADTQNVDQNLDLSQDSSSPFYLHSSDNPGMKLVSMKFNGNGYSDWKQSMMISLTAKIKTGFVDGTMTKPVVAGAVLRAWERCNVMMISCMLGVLEQNIARSVLYFKTVREIWLNLEERYGQASGTMLFSLQQSLVEVKQGTDNISGYNTKMKMLWDQLDSLDRLPSCACTNCTCQINQKLVKSQEDRRFVDFLMKLNEGFEMIRGNILVMTPLPSISQAYRLLLQEEGHKKLFQNVSGSGATTEDTMAFGARRNFQDRFKPQYAQNKQNFSDTRRNTYYCDHCKMSGHTIQRCYKLHGYPSGRNNADKRQAAAVQLDDNESKVISNDNISFTATQYQQILKLIGKEKLLDDNQGDSNKSANMAGPFNEATTSW